MEILNVSEKIYIKGAIKSAINVLNANTVEIIESYSSFLFLLSAI